jgi:serine/threonine-protein kinase
MTDASSWARLKELFFIASEMSRAGQEELLAELAPGEPEIAARLSRLLAAHERTGGFVENALSREADSMLTDAAASAWIGRRVGPYEIVRLLGRGGMGTVFLAERADGAFEKQVAVKLVSAPVASETLLRRFAAERKTLAQFEHPNIARLVDGGATAEGVPYLVMEYVDGLPIDRYCEEKSLGVTARLELFLSVCDAVENAHRHLVVHRDLKPSNVLVTREGTVKLLDFGIAKVVSGDSEASLQRTATKMDALTPAYASPEQVRGGPITTSTDVYALGILLHRLLTGDHPYEFPDSSLAAAERVICEQEPERASDALVRKAREVGDAAATRRARRVRGDLDKIVQQALRKEPPRRYGSVGELAEDVRRHLSGRAIAARSDSAWYKTAIFVRRHRVQVAAGALVAASLLAGIAVATRQARRAEAERAKAQELNRFLQGMLGAADSSWYSAGRAHGSATTVSQVLDQAAERAGVDFVDRPEIEATIRTTLGKTYRSLGLLGPSEAQLRRAVELERRLVGEDHPDFADTSSWLAQTLMGEAKLDEAEPMLRHSIAVMRGALPARAARLVGAINDLGLLLWGRGDTEKAEPAFLEAIALSRRYLGDGAPIEAAALGNVGLIHDARGDLDGALDFYRQALAALERIPGPPFFEHAISQSNIATVLRIRGQYPESERLYNEALATLEKTLGPDDATFVAPMLANLADLHRLEGRIAEADREINRSLDLLAAKFPRDHPLFGWAEAVHGLVLLESGHVTEGEASLRRALDVCRRSFRPNDRRTALTEAELGHCLAIEHRYVEAEPLLVEGSENLSKALGDGHPRTKLARSWLAEMHTDEVTPRPRTTAPSRTPFK